MAKWYENDPVLEEAVGSATTPPAPESKPGKKNWYDSDTVIEPDKTKAKLIAGDALSRKDLQDMGVEEQTNAKQRKVIGDVIRRQPANRYAAAGMGGFSPDIRTEDVAAPEPTVDSQGRSLLMRALGATVSGPMGGTTAIGRTPEPIRPQDFAPEFGKAMVRRGLNIAGGLVSEARNVGMDAVHLYNIVKSGALFDDTANQLAEGLEDPEYRHAARTLAGAKGALKAAEQKFPATAQGTAAWLGRTLGDAIGFTAATVTANFLGGPLAASAVVFSTEGNAAYDNAIQTGATEEQGLREKFLVGSINSALELWQIDEILKFGRGGKAALVNAIRQKIGGRALTGRILKLAATEGLQEFSQEGVSQAAPAALRGDYAKTSEGNPDWKAILKRQGEAALGGAVAGTFLGGVRRGGGIIAERIGQRQITSEQPTVPKIVAPEAVAGQTPAEPTVTAPQGRLTGQEAANEFVAKIQKAVPGVTVREGVREGDRTGLLSGQVTGGKLVGMPVQELTTNTEQLQRNLDEIGTRVLGANPQASDTDIRREQQKWVDSAIQEEVIHAKQSEEGLDYRAAEKWEALPKKVRQLMKWIYDEKAAFEGTTSEESPETLYLEYDRIVRQLKETGRMSEDVLRGENPITQALKKELGITPAEPTVTAPQGEITPEDALFRVGQAQIEVEKAIKKHGFGGITEAEQHPNVVATERVKKAAFNDLYNSLNPKYKIGESFEWEGHNWTITQATFDITKSVDTQIKTGFPSTFDFWGIDATREDGKESRLFTGYGPEVAWLREIDTSQVLKNVIAQATPKPAPAGISPKPIKTLLASQGEIGAGQAPAKAEGKQIPARPLVNPKASALQRDKQLVAHQKWDREYGPEAQRQKVYEDSDKTLRRNVLQSRIKRGEQAPVKLLEEFRGEPWADAALAKQAPAPEGKEVPPVALPPEIGTPGALQEPSVMQEGPPGVSETPPQPPGPPQPPSIPPTAPAPAPRQGPIQLKAPGKIRQVAESIYQNYMNKVQSIENRVRRLQKLGLNVKAGQNPGLIARTYASIGLRIHDTLEYRTFRLTEEGNNVDTGEGLKPILDDLSSTMKPVTKKVAQQDVDFQDYMVSTRTILDLQRKAYEGAKRNIVSDKQVAEAQRKLDVLRQKYGEAGMKSIEQAADRFYGFQRRVLHLLVDAGYYTEKQYNEIVAKNQHYIPFDRIIPDVETVGLVGGAKKGFESKGKPLRKIKGSELDVQPVVESVVKSTARIVEAAYRNMVPRSMAKLMPNIPAEMNPIHVRMRPIKVDPKEILTVRKEFRQQSRHIMDEVKETKTTQGAQANISGPAAKLEQVVKEALSHRGFSEAEAGAFINQIRKGGGEGAVAEVVTTEKLKQIIRETERLIITQEPIETTIFRPSPFKPSGRVVEYFDNGKRKYMELSPNLYSAMSALDQTSSSLLVKIASIPGQTLRVGATITPEFIVRNPIRDNYTTFMSTDFGVIPFIDPIGASAALLGKTELYHNWIRSGGGYSGFVELSRAALKNVVKELRMTKGQKALRKLNLIADLQDVSQFFEQLTRLGVFKAGKRAGMSDIEAAYESREASIDFARKGGKGEAFRRVTAFFNANLQAFDKTARTFYEHPYATAIKGLIAFTIPEILLFLVNRREPEYWQLHRWRRDLFYNFKIGGIWWMWPKNLIYGQIFGTLPLRFMEYADSRDSKSFDDLTQTLIESAIPVQGDPLGSILPTILKPLIENANNRNMFFEQPLVPQYIKEGRRKPEQYTRYTSEAAKYLSRWQDEQLKMLPELLKASPAQIENLLQGYSGGTGRYLLQGTDFLVRQLQEIQGKEPTPRRPRELADYPLIKAFIGRDPLASPESLKRFYEYRDDIIRAEGSYKAAADAGNDARAEAILKRFPELELAKDMRAAATDLSKIGAEIEAIIADKTLDDAKKRAQIKELDMEKLQITQDMNKTIEDFKKEQAPKE